MFSPPSIQLLAYANQSCGELEQAPQAQILVAVLHGCQRNYIELDFSGVFSVSKAFCDEFFRLAKRELAETWLMPKNYHRNPMVDWLLSRLKRQREEAWVKGCERFTTGIHPVTTECPSK